MHFEIGGVPIGGVPIGGVPIGGVPIGGVPIGGVPIGGVPIGVTEEEEEEDDEGVVEFECVGGKLRIDFAILAQTSLFVPFGFTLHFFASIVISSLFPY